jgi:hypothetical protein
LSRTTCASCARQARLLAWLGVGWHGIEAAVAIVAILLVTRAI